MLKSSLKDSLKMSKCLQFPLKEKATYMEQNWAMTLLKRFHWRHERSQENLRKLIIYAYSKAEKRNGKKIKISKQTRQRIQ